VIFSELVQDLQKELNSNMPQIRLLLIKTPALAFTTINEISSKVGKRYNIIISLNFPERGKIQDFQSYGTENIGMIIDRFRKTFPIKRELIKTRASEILGNVEIHDAYMYEGKEGVRVVLGSVRLDILPASLHVWGKFDGKVTEFCDWLLANCYQLKPGVSGAESEVSS
jgi:hypothetical protein